MKNNECTIYISTRRGSTQTYRKVGDVWTQTTAKGVVRLYGPRSQPHGADGVAAGTVLLGLVVVDDGMV